MPSALMRCETIQSAMMSRAPRRLRVIWRLDEAGFWPMTAASFTGR